MEFADKIRIPKLNGVTMRGPHISNTSTGTLVITGHHLIFSSRSEDVELWILNRNIDIVEKKLNTITLKCKDFRIIVFDMPYIEQATSVAASIESLIMTDEADYLHHMFSNKSNEYRSPFDVQSQCEKLVAGDSMWRISQVNKSYRVCGTYPELTVVPSNVDDTMLIASAKFRQNGRFPVLSYRHEKGSVLMRSSQPLVGSSSKRCKQDERVINSVLGPGKRGYIIDTRSVANATNAKARGGGFEMEAHYPQWRRVNSALERHNVLLDSLSKIVEACNDTTCTIERWLNKLNGSEWLSHVKDTLNAACLVAQCLNKERASVLVHGSESTDATLVLISLTQLILNPECRTIVGFESLIEREWLQAGHPFETRHKSGCYNAARSKVSSSSSSKVFHHGSGATFLLFLDCTWQIHNQFPCCFEFSTNFLSSLVDHSYCSDFSTFYGNCESDRKNNQYGKPNLWSHFDQKIDEIINPLYLHTNNVIWPSVAPFSIELWRDMYLRWSIDQTHQKKYKKSIDDLIKRNKELKVLATKLLNETQDSGNKST
ncbi:myotubularin-related protein 9 [Acyrthosiphon pisum]|uniref:Myotubularin phosphatase domain-containing protein n=1 Tax=Acyrthosiphon pisum TaxID=7029 RepID=A0A8R2ACP5_ACYPI|nr:myotubularin-related protein 9 [Acyrthosiphon pisum]XP_008186988.1 myotubularin-related protein 9 [Acyrthosiphon pisum]|eukprot:XP_001948155.2 PREDICTED: myotubularin-related protein 9 [Acyrthosiphon pisum]